MDEIEKHPVIQQLETDVEELRAQIHNHEERIQRLEDKSD